MMDDYNYIDLFHGIGGFALGAYMAGMKFKNHFCSDVEKYCQRLYKLRFPDSIQLGDIKKINTKDLKKYGNKWIITGGFPCQDISIAGRGVGIFGTRSGLWFEYWRIIRDLRPEFAIMENVSALSFRGLDAVLGSLAEIGYNAEWQDIRAADMGAPHRRERLWIVAHSNSFGHLQRQNEIKSTHKRKFAQHNISAESENVANPTKSGLPQSQENKKQKQLLYVERGNSEIPNTIQINDDNSGYGTGKIFRGQSKTPEIQGRISNTDKQGLQEFARGQFKSIQTTDETFKGCEFSGGFTAKKSRDWWAIEPDVGRLVDGIPHRVDRLKGLGNSIVPQIAELLFNQIKPLLN